jgi:hypothetical protein
MTEEVRLFVRGVDGSTPGRLIERLRDDSRIPLGASEAEPASTDVVLLCSKSVDMSVSTVLGCMDLCRASTVGVVSPSVVEVSYARASNAWSSYARAWSRYGEPPGRRRPLQPDVAKLVGGPDPDVVFVQARILQDSHLPSGRLRAVQAPYVAFLKAGESVIREPRVRAEATFVEQLTPRGAWQAMRSILVGTQGSPGLLMFPYSYASATRRERWADTQVGRVNAVRAAVRGRPR